MKKTGILIVLALLISPLFVSVTSAKSVSMKGLERGKGKELSVSEPLGWAIKLSLSSHTMGTIESYPGMAVVRLVGYKPWWKVWGSMSATTTLRISGLPASSVLPIYTRGYREHNQATTTSQGTLELDFASKLGAQFIIKSKPSTKHIDIDPIFGPPGGDCDDIGMWNASSKTCTLDRDVFETISIEDSGITLNGNDKSVIGPNSGDGIYTDESDVRVTNVEVHHFDRGIVYADALTTVANGGKIDGTTLADNILNIMDEGVSDLVITDNDIVSAESGLTLLDQTDGFATDGIVITSNNFKNNKNNDFYQEGTSFNLDTDTDRGNWWQRNTGCEQDPAKPNQCTNSYNEGDGTDNKPWVCESAWRAGVKCTIKPPEPKTCSNNVLDSDELGVDCGVGCSRQCGSCVPLVINGKAEGKIDIVFVGSGFSNVADLARTATEVADVSKNGNGLFNTAPFSSYLNDFNIWAVADQQTFTSEVQSERQSRRISRSTCSTDQMILLSINPRFVSHAYVQNGNGGADAFLTIGCEYLGTCDYPLDISGGNYGSDKTDIIRTVVHEFGHSFGGLSDEYTYTDSSGKELTTNLKPEGSPNCDSASSSPKWKDITSTVFPGCSYSNWYRPFHNSIMLNQFVKPFVPFRAVNEANLEADIRQLTNNQIDFSGSISNESYVVDINYTNGKWTMSSLLRVPVQVNNVVDRVGTDRIDILDDNKEVIVSVPFVSPLVRVYSPSKNAFNIDGTQKSGVPTGPTIENIGTANFSINLPIYPTAKFFNLYDSSGVLKNSIDTNGNTVDPTPVSDKISICHRPPGNPNNAHTLYLPASAIKAHLGHGDVVGECPNLIEQPSGKKTDKRIPSGQAKKNKK